MKILSLIILAFIFLGCVPKEVKPESTPVREVIIKEPFVVEKLVFMEKPEEACPKVQPCAKPKVCKPITIYKEYQKAIIGELEEVYFPMHELLLRARIDTGAQTTSLDAQNIVAFERDGKKWVRFEVGKDKKKIQIKRPIVKTIKVKRHGEVAQDRYVVQMRLNLASISSFVEVSLTDRQKYKFPVLIGRNYLQGTALVDVNLQYTQAPSKDK